MSSLYGFMLTELFMHIRGYTGVYANGDGVKGVAECPFDFYHQWVKNPLLAQAMSEKVTRSTIGVACCPVVSGCCLLISRLTFASVGCT